MIKLYQTHTFNLEEGAEFLFLIETKSKFTCIYKNKIEGADYNPILDNFIGVF